MPDNEIHTTIVQALDTYPGGDHEGLATHLMGALEVWLPAFPRQ